MVASAFAGMLMDLLTLALGRLRLNEGASLWDTGVKIILRSSFQ